MVFFGGVLILSGVLYIYYCGVSNCGTCSKFYKYESSQSLGKTQESYGVFCGLCDPINTLFEYGFNWCRHFFATNVLAKFIVFVWPEK